MFSAAVTKIQAKSTTSSPCTNAWALNSALAALGSNRVDPQDHVIYLHEHFSTRCASV